MASKKEVVEHVVKVDDYMEVRLKIPKVLTAMELKGLMSKANNLFKLSEAKMYAGYRAEKTVLTPTYEETKTKKKPGPKPASKKNNQKSDQKTFVESGKYAEVKKYIEKNYHELGGTKIAKKFNMSNHKVYNLAWAMRKKGIIK